LRRLPLIALLVLAAAAARCGGQTRAPQHVAAPKVEHKQLPAPKVAAPPTVAPCSRRYRSLLSSRSAWAAVVRSPVTAYRAPGRRAFADFGRLNVNGYPTVFSVRGKLVGRDCTVRWLKVELPIKPNGVTGWVRAARVDVAKVRARILVDLSDRRVTLFRGGRPVFAARAAVGAAATPTPTGRFYVNQRLVPADTSGPFGPGALGISAFSEVLTGWVQGGPVAIHGTNAPWLIGQAVSNGCIRVRNDDLRRLFRQALAGTPVVIRA
jgi:lipoprotein-anchoring transpeptidase ErfK/SrfK